MARVVWARVISFELQPQIHKNYSGAHIHACTEWCWSTHTLENKTGMHCTAVDSSVCVLFVCLFFSGGGGGEGGISTEFFQWWSSVQCRLKWSKFFQWHSNVGQLQLSSSSDVPVYPASIRRSPGGIPVYTGSISGIAVALPCTLAQPLYSGSG